MTSMTTPPADVNDVFADGQRGRIDTFNERIANGTLVPLGDGRFRSTGSDAGETWIVQGANLLPQHGLDMTSGQAALYTAVPAWHGLGSVIPGGITDVDEVLRLGRIDYEVNRRPVLFRNQVDGPTLVCPDQYVTVRGDTEAPLGVVGKQYTVIQNRDAFDFLSLLVNDHNVTWESAGALFEGRRVFVSMRLPEGIRIDAVGINDEIVPFIVAVNSHDGSTSFQVVATPWRPVCRNTERFAIRDAHARWSVRHTVNARQHVDQARKTLGLAVAYYERFTVEENALAASAMAVGDYLAVVEQLWPTPDEDASQRTHRIHDDRTANLVRLWEANAEKLGRTGYAAERAITEFLDHHAVIKPRGGLKGNNALARATAQLTGDADDKKAHAHRTLLLRTNR